MINKLKMYNVDEKIQLEIINTLINDEYKFQYNAIPVSHFIETLNYDMYLIYEAVQELMSQNVLIRVHTAECPSCSEENLFKNEDDTVQCNNCGETYNLSTIYEKYVINK